MRLLTLLTKPGKHQEIKIYNMDTFEKDETFLYKELTELAKSSKAKLSIETFEKYLEHKSPDIRSASIYGLLFSLKIRDLRYKAKALFYLDDKKEDFDLRQWCVSGLSQAYEGSQDLELMSKFYQMLNDKNEDSELKPALLRGLLRIAGLNSRDIFLRVGIVKKVDELVLNKFSEELSRIKGLIN